MRLDFFPLHFLIRLWPASERDNERSVFECTITEMGIKYVCEILYVCVCVCVFRVNILLHFSMVESTMVES